MYRAGANPYSRNRKYFIPLYSEVLRISGTYIIKGVTFKYENGDSTIENFSYSYVEDSGEKWITVIDSSLEGEYDVVLTATKLRLEFYENGNRIYFEFERI